MKKIMFLKKLKKNGTSTTFTILKTRKMLKLMGSIEI